MALAEAPEVAVVRASGPVSVPKGSATPVGAEFLVNRDDLFSELSIVLAAVERRTTIPMLSSFLLVAAGARLNVSGTDLDTSLESYCEARVLRSGACTIPARRFYEYVRLLPAGQVAIKLMDNRWVEIRSGRSRTKMVAMDRDSFPQITTFPDAGAVGIPASLMRSLISRTLFAVSSEESRYTLNGALLLLTKSSIRMVATDGHRLAHVENPDQPLDLLAAEKRTLVPRKALTELANLLSLTQEETVDFMDDAQNLYFRVGRRVLISRRLTGEFPNYANVIPRDNTKSAMVRAADLLASIQRVAQFADERSGAVKMRLTDNLLSISARSIESGESEDTIETSYNGEPVSIGFNSTYLIDFLKAIGTQGEVRLELKDTRSAAVLRPEGGDPSLQFKFVLMPLRV